MKKIIALICVAAVIFCTMFGFTVFPSDASLSSLESQRENAEQKRAEAEKKMQQLQAQIEQAKIDESRQMETKMLLQEQLSVIEAQIEDASADLRDLEERLEENNTILSNLKSDYDNTYALYRKRVRVNYENGKTSLLQVILTSNDISEMLTRIDLISQLAEYDQTLLNKLSVSIKEQERLTDESEQAIEFQKEINDELQLLLDEQKSKIKEVDAILKKLSSNEDKYIEEMQKYDKLMDEYDKQINDLVSAIKAYKGGELIWPVPGVSRISSGYGNRTYTYNGKIISDFHAAIDIPAATGTKIVAAAAGTVISAKKQSDGNMQIVIDHGNGLTTRYNHLSKFNVKAGDIVEKGDVIGYVGSTGNSTGPHLDFRIYYVDPSTGEEERLNPSLYVNPTNSTPKESIQEYLDSKK